MKIFDLKYPFKNVMIQGLNGTGKTRFSLKLASFFYSLFNRPVFIMQNDNVLKIKDLKSSIIIIDDIDYYLDKRLWNTKEQRGQVTILSQLLSRTRHNKNTYILISRPGEINTFLQNKIDFLIFIRERIGKYVSQYIIDMNSFDFENRLENFNDLPSSYGLPEVLTEITDLIK